MLIMYSKYLEDTRTEKMSSLLEEKAPGRFSEDQRIQISEFFLDKKILTKDLHIKIYTEASAFAEAVTLDDHKLDHSWAGDRIYKDCGDWLVGNGEFGLKYWRQYSDNGNCSIPQERTEDPEFDTSRVQVAYKKSYHLNSFRTPAREWTHHELLVLLP